MKRITALAVAALGLTGCGGAGGTYVPPGNPDLNGSWSGTIEFHNTVFPTTVDMFIMQSGTTLSSSGVQFNINFAGGCSGFGPMTGSVNGDNVTMTIAGSSTIPATAITATSSQGALSGTFTTSGKCDGGDQGNFSAILIPSFASSQWSGSITSGATVIPLTANLSEDRAGHLTGTVSLAGQATPCNSSITVTGTQTGRELVIFDSQGLLNAGGDIDVSNKNINGGATGSCAPGGLGNFSMTRP